MILSSGFHTHTHARTRTHWQQKPTCMYTCTQLVERKSWPSVAGGGGKKGMTHSRLHTHTHIHATTITRTHTHTHPQKRKNDRRKDSCLPCMHAPWHYKPTDRHTYGNVCVLIACMRDVMCNMWHASDITAYLLQDTLYTKTYTQKTCIQVCVPMRMVMFNMCGDV